MWISKDASLMVDGKLLLHNLYPRKTTFVINELQFHIYIYIHITREGCTTFLFYEDKIIHRNPILCRLHQDHRSACHRIPGVAAGCQCVLVARHHTSTCHFYEKPNSGDTIYIYIYTPPPGVGLEQIRKWLVYTISLCICKLLRYALFIICIQIPIGVLGGSNPHPISAKQWVQRRASHSPQHPDPPS